MTDASKGVYGFSFRGDSSSCVELQHAMYAYSGIEDYLMKMENAPSTHRNTLSL